MTRRARVLAMLCAALLPLGAVAAQQGIDAPYANRQLSDPRAEARALALMEELRCLVCQGQSIADSDAQLAGAMRDAVRSRIAAGESPDQVRGWMIDRYGDWVSYDPPSSGITLLLWLVPVALLLGALLAAYRIFGPPGAKRHGDEAR